MRTNPARFMQKILLLLLSVLGLFLIRQAALANDIEPGKEFYTATHITNRIELNGDLSEWAGVPVLADPKFLIPKSTLRAPGDPGTLVLFVLCPQCIARRHLHSFPTRPSSYLDH